MTEDGQYFRYVTHNAIPDYESLGWKRLDCLAGTTHGVWSELMRWDGDGDPVEPAGFQKRREMIG